MKKINILNGQVMYDYFRQTRIVKDEIMIPFNEAMCHGEIAKDIFSDEFANVRAKSLNVTVDMYRKITLEPLQPLFNNKFPMISLWFDADMFCQINLLTILAWLDEKSYPHFITLNTVNDKFEIIKKDQVKANGYQMLYNQVLFDKSMPQHVDLTLLKRGIEHYLNYLNPDGELIVFINEHQHVRENELIALLLERFTHYGLGDTQYSEIIRKNRQPLS